MAKQRVVPAPDRTVLKEDGSRMTGACAVDTSRQYYRNRLRDGDIEVVERKPAPKKAMTKESSDDS